jgi:hypothetical protein
MEEIEITSWLTLDAIKNEAEIEEIVGDLQTGHCQAVFCIIEGDYLELCYSDAAASFIRRYEDKNEFLMALERRREEFGEGHFAESNSIEEESEDPYETEDESEDF